MTLTLTDFLLARIAEDEAAARDTRWLALEYGVDSYGQEAFAARVLAECEAKRRIVARADCLTEDSELQEIGWGILGCLALPYASHPDYDESWKP